MRSTVALVAALVVVSFMSGSSETESVAARVITGHNLSVAVPSDWDGRIYVSDEGLVVVQSANVPLEQRELDGDVGSASIKKMGSDGIFVAIWYWHDQSGTPNLATPLQIGRSDFGDFGCFGDSPPPAAAMRMGTIDGHRVQAVVSFGTETPDHDAVTLANRILASFQTPGVYVDAPRRNF
jgi:hypothetical protein